MDFTGKSAVVVGGAGGIGFELCRELLKQNLSNLAIIDIQDRQTELLKQLNDEFTSKYIVYVKTDVSKQELLSESFNQIVVKFKQINIVINTAGIFNDKDVNQTLAVNAGGVINSSILAVDHMHKELGGNGGIIINISSIVGLDPLHLLPVYSASKDAIISFTRAFSNNYYYKRTGVKLITICPGATLTNFLEDFPPKMIYPDEETALKYFNEFPKQSVEDLVQHIIKAIGTAENGSVWICDNNVMTSVSFNKYWNHSS